MNNFEWRDGRVWFLCGRCKGYWATEEKVRLVPGRIVRYAYCHNRDCHIEATHYKQAEDWQGIEMEARNLMYA